MTTFSTTALAFGLMIFALVTLVAAPTAASAAGMGSGKNGTTCKSGKHVRDAKFCKENGGKA